MKKCSIRDKEFESEERLQTHNNAKHRSECKEPVLSYRQKQKIKNWSITLGILVLFVGVIFYMITSIKTLPPTDMQGHVEQNPISHKLRTPMSIQVQKHMLEHSDSKGPPGVIINYNCVDYTCQEDLIDNLETFADEFSHVYIAPFPKMDAKIALTKLGTIKILDGFNEAVIRSFITLG